MWRTTIASSMKAMHEDDIVSRLRGRGTVLFLFCICSLLIFLIALLETARLPYPTFVRR